MAQLNSFRSLGGQVGDTYTDAQGVWAIQAVYDDGNYNWGLIQPAAGQSGGGVGTIAYTEQYIINELVSVKEDVSALQSMQSVDNVDVNTLMHTVSTIQVDLDAVERDITLLQNEVDVGDLVAIFETAI